jgi:hypothetical protein
MHRAIGLGVLAVGIVLLVLGISAADSPASEWSRFFTGEPTDRAIWLMIGGVAGIVVGGVMAAMSKKQLVKG